LAIFVASHCLLQSSPIFRQLSGLQNNIRFLQSDLLLCNDANTRIDLQNKISKLTEKYNDILMNPNHAIGGIIDPQMEGQSPGSGNSDDCTDNPGYSPSDLSATGSEELSPSESDTSGNGSNEVGESAQRSDNGSSSNGQSTSNSSNGSSSNDGSESGGEDETQDFPPTGIKQQQQQQLSMKEAINKAINANIKKGSVPTVCNPRRGKKRPREEISDLAASREMKAKVNPTTQFPSMRCSRSSFA
jgi:hypothetical protein